MGNLESALPVIVVGLSLVVVLLVIATIYLLVKLREVSSGQVQGEVTAPTVVTPEPPAVVETAPVVVAPPEPVIEKVEKEKTPEPVVEAKQKSDLSGSIPDAILPILIAAAATAVGKPVRIKDVVLVQTEKPNVWGTQGRIVIQRSHDTSSQQW
jgi:hypothetical protein